MSIAIIHAGPSAFKLQKLIKELDSVLGSGNNSLMSDIVTTLQSDDDFLYDLNDLLAELVNPGGYFHYKLNESNINNKTVRAQTAQFMDIVASTSQRVAIHLHTTLVNQSRYNADGEFLYEYCDFDGRVLRLRSL